MSGTVSAVPPGFWQALAGLVNQGPQGQTQGQQTQNVSQAQQIAQLFGGGGANLTNAGSMTGGANMAGGGMAGGTGNMIMRALMNHIARQRMMTQLPFQQQPGAPGPAGQGMGGPLAMPQLPQIQMPQINPALGALPPAQASVGLGQMGQPPQQQSPQTQMVAWPYGASS